MSRGRVLVRFIRSHTHVLVSVSYTIFCSLHLFLIDKCSILGVQA